MLRTDLFDFGLERGGDVTRRFVRNDCDPFVRFQTQAITDRVPRSGLKLRIECDGVGAIGHGLKSGQLYAKIRGEAMHDRRNKSP
jgi:hypothetical protein